MKRKGSKDIDVALRYRSFSELRESGRNIQAKKGETVFGGTVSRVYKDVFGY